MLVNKSNRPPPIGGCGYSPRGPVGICMQGHQRFSSWRAILLQSFAGRVAAFWSILGNRRHSSDRNRDSEVDVRLLMV